MGKIFSFCNQKGGVGKTTSAVNIATCLSKYGYKVLLLDMDSQANTTSGLGEEKPSLEFTTYQLLVDNSDPRAIVKRTDIENLDLIPSNPDLSGVELELVNRERREFCLKSRVTEISKDYDFVLIDCPPSLGLMTVNCLTASNYVIIPLQCEYYALEGLGQLLHTYQLVKEKLNPDLDIGGVLMTMADLRTNLTQQVIEEVKNYFKDKMFNTIICRSVKISEAPSFGKPAVLYDANSRGSKGYVEVTKEFVGRFAEKNLIPEDEKKIFENKESNNNKTEEVKLEANENQ